MSMDSGYCSESDAFDRLVDEIQILRDALLVARAFVVSATVGEAVADDAFECLYEIDQAIKETD